MATVKRTNTNFKNLIGGKWVSAHSRKTFENRNPAKNRDLVGIFPLVRHKRCLRRRRRSERSL